MGASTEEDDVKTKSRVYEPRQPRQGKLKTQMDHLKRLLRSAIKARKQTPRTRKP